MRLELLDFEEVFNENDSNRAYDIFLNIYKTLFEEIFPLQEVKINKKFLKQHSWMTNGLITSSLNKKKLFENKLKHPSDQNIENYKNYVKAYNKLIRAHKKSYYSEILEENKRNMKRTWEILNKLINPFTAEDQKLLYASKIVENQYFFKFGEMYVLLIGNQDQHDYKQ